MNQFAQIKTSQGPASLSMKVGIGAGEILEANIGGVLDRWEYVVGGDPLVQVAMAEHQAKPGQIILSPQAWAEGQTFFIGTPLENGQGFVHLYKAIDPLSRLTPTTLDWTQLSQDQRQHAEQALQRYVPHPVKARLHEQQSEWVAELRRMTVLFIGIGGFDYEADDAGQQLQQFLQSVQEVIYRFEGTLGKVAVDDKGTVLLVLFGAPPLFHEGRFRVPRGDGDSLARGRCVLPCHVACPFAEEIRVTVYSTEQQVNCRHRLPRPMRSNSPRGTTR